MIEILENKADWGLEIPPVQYTCNKQKRNKQRHFQLPKNHINFNIEKRLNFYNFKRFFDIGMATMIMLWWLLSTIEIIGTGAAAHTWNFYQFLVTLCRMFSGLF